MAIFAPLKTQNLELKPFDSSFLTSEYVSWLNDKEVVKFSEQRHKKHDFTTCETFMKSFTNSPNYFIAICLKSGEHIGNASVIIDGNNKLADIAIMIGKKKYWGNSYGKEAFGAILNYLIENKLARKITAGTMSENKAMLAILKNSGMHEECTRKEHFLLDGKEVDIVYFAKRV